MAKFYPCDVSSIAKAVGYVQQYLEKHGFKRETISKTLLRLEDVIHAVIRKARDPKERFSLSLHKKFGIFGKTVIAVRCRGAMVTRDDVIQGFEYEGLEPEAVQVLNKKLLSLMSAGLTLRNRLGINTAVIEVGSGRVSRVAANLLTMGGGILLGVLLRLILPQTAASFIGTEVFGTVVTLFFNLLKMIVAPLVFFSIIASVSGFTDIKELGSVGAKTVALFVGFSLIGLLIGYGTFAIMPSGDPGIRAMLDCPDAAVAAGSTSSLAWQNTKAFLNSIFPSNLLGAFVDNNVLGVIFIAVLVGVAVSKVQPEKAASLNKAIDVGNELIMKITSIITGMMPILIFCSMVKLAMTVNVSLLGTLARYLGAVFIGFALMFVIYMIVLAVRGISPLFFLKGFGPALLTGFTLASSAATVPASLDCCTKNLRLPRSVAYFVIPLGSTINMNGSCIMLLISCLFLTNVFCLNVTFTMMIPAMLMILLLSMAAPGVPGSMVIMLATVLPIIGVPAEAASVTIWFSSIVGMLMVPVNSMGDAVTAMLISKGKKQDAQEAE